MSIDSTFDESLPYEDTSYEWCPTPCVKSGLKTLNDFIRSTSSLRGKVEPVVRQLGIPWREAAPSTQRYYRQKGKEVVELALDCLAPGQATVLLSQLIEDSERREKQNSAKNADSSELSRLIKLYEEANSWFIKRQILSVFVNDYTKARLQQLIPRLSIWAIDEARKHAAKIGLGKPVQQMENITRTRLDPNKVDHFLDFISRPNFLQDVAYGTKTLKLSNGELIEIPNVVRTVIASRLVELYKRYSEETSFIALGRSTLFSILQVSHINIRSQYERRPNKSRTRLALKLFYPHLPLQNIMPFLFLFNLSSFLQLASLPLR